MRSPCALVARGGGSPRPPTGTSQPGNGCQGCLASLAPDSLITEPGQAPAEMAQPRESLEGKNNQKNTRGWGSSPRGDRTGDPGVRAATTRPTTHPSTHLSTCSWSCPRLCLILFCASTLSISAALSPLMVTMTSPGRRSPAAAFPCSVTSKEKGTWGTSPLLSWSHPPSLDPRHAGGKNRASLCAAFMHHRGPGTWSGTTSSVLSLNPTPLGRSHPPRPCQSTARPSAGVCAGEGAPKATATRDGSWCSPVRGWHNPPRRRRPPWGRSHGAGALKDSKQDPLPGAAWHGTRPGVPAALPGAKRLMGGALTLEMVMGLPKSLPPVMRKPQGAGPARVTVTGMAAGGSGQAGSHSIRKPRGG